MENINKKQYLCHRVVLHNNTKHLYPRVMQHNNTQQYLDPIVVQYKTGVTGRNSAKLEMLTEDEVGRWKIFGMWEE